MFFGYIFYESEVLSSSSNGSNLISFHNKTMKFTDDLNVKLSYLFENNFILLFNKNESIQLQERKVNFTTKDLNLLLLNPSCLNDSFYKNIITNSYSYNLDTSSTPFMFSFKLPKHEWFFFNDTKCIGFYTCYKATLLIKNCIVDDKNQLSNAKSESSSDLLLEAWYTLDIPVSNGPLIFGGLPGLIMELSSKYFSITCKNVVVNSDYLYTNKSISLESFILDELHKIKDSNPIIVERE